MRRCADIAELVACLGEAGTLRLVEARGGTRVHVPTRDFTKKSFLNDILDEASLARLADAFGGIALEIPLCREWRIGFLLKQGGASHAEIARRCNTTERHVQRLSKADWTPMPHGYNGLRRKDAGSDKQLLLPLLLKASAGH